MILVSYDIADDKLRNRFSKYLKKFGYRVQYSVYKIENSERIVTNIENDINNKFLKMFHQEDSVYIFHLSSSCSIKKYGYAANEDTDLLVVK